MTREASVAFRLEASDLVQRYTRNDHLDLGTPVRLLRRATPRLSDFIARLVNGVHLLLEIKGREEGQDREKAEAEKRWADAVTAWNQMGRWVFDTCRRREDVPRILAHHADTTSVAG